MMELQKIKVSVTKSDKIIKELEECYEGSLSSLAVALKNIKSTTNDYLTELVDTEKNVNSSTKGKSKTKANYEKPVTDENEESDIEIEEDFIDSQIKQELSTRHTFSSHSANRNEKRTRSQSISNKRLKQ